MLQVWRIPKLWLCPCGGYLLAWQQASNTPNDTSNLLHSTGGVQTEQEKQVNAIHTDARMINR